MADSCLPPHSRSSASSHVCNTPSSPATRSSLVAPRAADYISSRRRHHSDQRNPFTEQTNQQKLFASTQSKRTAAATMASARALRLVASRPHVSHGNLLVAARRRLLSAGTEAGGAGDPAIHSGDAPSEEYTERPPRFSAAEEATGGHGKNPSMPSPSASEAATTTKERVPPFAPSGKLGSQELANPTDGSSFTQKRRWSSGAASGRDAREAATPGREESAARKVREDDREYYRTHKPSPLAEVEFADTRKPITRATDGGAADRLADVPGRTVEDTVDDSLARAEAMFREAASRGNPAWPHSRALAEMLARRSKEGHAGNDAPWGS